MIDDHERCKWVNVSSGTSSMMHHFYTALMILSQLICKKHQVENWHWRGGLKYAASFCQKSLVYHSISRKNDLQWVILPGWHQCFRSH